jgi:hypothetical protein
MVRTLAATSDTFATLHTARERPHQSHAATAAAIAATCCAPSRRQLAT